MAPVAGSPSETRECSGDQMAGVVAMESLLSELVEHCRVEPDLPRAGHLDRGGGSFQGYGVAVEDPESDGDDSVPLDLGRNDADGDERQPHERQQVGELVGEETRSDWQAG